MLEGLQEFLTIGATITGIYVGIGGLNAWKRETTGKRDIELCQKVVELFYEAEEKMAALRSPLTFVSEGSERQAEVGETEDEKNRRDTLFVPIARFNKQLDFWLELQSYKFRMRALFGDQATKPFTEVDKSLREFRSASTVRYRLLSATGEARNPEAVNRFEEKIWEGLADDDVIVGRMKSAIKGIEEICIPIVRSSRNDTLVQWVKKRLPGAFARTDASKS